MFVVLLYLHPGGEAGLDSFELAAAEVMSRHGGRIESRVRIDRKGDPSQPDEVHVVTFPDEEAFHRYRKDPATLAMAERRAAIIRETVVWAAANPGAGARAEDGRSDV